MARHIQFDNSGNFLAAYTDGGSAVFSAAAGTNTSPATRDKGVPANRDEEQGNGEWVNWGSSNDFPAEVYAALKKNGVASRGLKLKSDMLYGQQIIICKVKDFDPVTRKEIVEVIKDPEISAFLRRSNINEVRYRLAYDYTHLAQAFPIFYLNEDRSKIVMVGHDKAKKFRYAPFDKTKGRIPHVIRSANWPNPSPEQREIISCIDSLNYALEVDRIRQDKATRYVFPVRSYDMEHDYYSVAVWNTLRESGWLKSSNNIPQLIASIMRNSMTIKYHIRIPLSYWTGLYPDWAKKSDKDRETIVSDKLDEMNTFLTGVDNNMKSFISHYAVDKVTGKEVAGWDISPVPDTAKYDAWNSIATIINAEILFAIGINPAIFGLGTPGGAHTGGANNGGSNIRESWLTMIAGSQAERDAIYSWWGFVRDYNGYDPEAEIRTIDQVLTTLDTGAGTTKTLS